MQIWSWKLLVVVLAAIAAVSVWYRSVEKENETRIPRKVIVNRQNIPSILPDKTYVPK